MKIEKGLLRSVGLALLVSAIVLNASPIAFSQRNGSQQRQPSQTQRSDVIPEDTVISVRINDYLSSRTSRVGDKFTATVATPVYVAGQIAIPAGSIIEGRVTQVITARRMNKPGAIAVDFDSITLPNGLTTQIVGALTSDSPEIQDQIDDENRMSGGKGRDTAVFIGSSGAIGAVLGAISGGAKGAAVGGAVGAGIGLASVMLKKGEEASVPAGTQFGIKLKQALPAPTDAGNVGAVDTGNRSTGDNVSADSSAETRAQAGAPSAPERRPSMPESRPSSQPEPENRESARVADTGVEPTPPASEETENNETNLSLSSPEMIRRAQAALNEEGYYEGEINGEMNARTSAALKTYQREKSLPESGALDEVTAKSLKIYGVKSAASRPIRNNETLPGSGERGNVRPASTPTSSTVKAEPPPASLPGNPSSVQTSAGTRNAASLLKQSQDLLAEYQRLIGVRLTGAGIESDGKTVYTDDDIDLLFALDSFANRVQLYHRLLPSLQSQQGIRSATLSMAKEARRTDRIFTTSSSRWINSLNPRWDAIRQDVLKLMYGYGISTAEIEN